MRYVIGLARETERTLHVRLVKGANLAMERVEGETLSDEEIRKTLRRHKAAIGTQLARVDGAVEAKVRFGLAFGAGVPLDQRFYLVPGADSSVALKFKIAASISLNARAPTMPSGMARINAMIP